jgi:hypothetical protein
MGMPVCLLVVSAYQSTITKDGLTENLILTSMIAVTHIEHSPGKVWNSV